MPDDQWGLHGQRLALLGKSGGGRTGRAGGKGVRGSALLCADRRESAGGESGYRAVASAERGDVFRGAAGQGGLELSDPGPGAQSGLRGLSAEGADGSHRGAAVLSRDARAFVRRRTVISSRKFPAACGVQFVAAVYGRRREKAE